MFKNKFLLGGFFILLLAIVYYSFVDSGNSGLTNDPDESISPEAYREQINAERKKKDEFFRTDADSPLTDKAGFNGLQYFKPNPAYRITAKLEPFADKTQKLVVRLSDGSEEVYDKVAHAVFSLHGTACRLLIVKQQDTYSILFRDATSNKQTYGGGRYLELNADKLTGNRAVLDFNAAYNPYCAYNPTYACPIPPAENTLPVPIEAGEQYVAHD